MSRRGRVWIRIVLACLLAAGSYWGLRAAQALRPVPISARIENYDQVIASIRHGLRVHSSRITVRFSYGQDILAELTEVVGDWTQEALEETECSTEGDYIRYQYGGYEIQCSSHPGAGGYDYAVAITPDYYMYLFQEEEVTARLAQVYDELDLANMTTDYEKVKTVYDYVCGHVRYDLVHQKHRNFHIRSTAYAALIRGTATCQGYCVLLYRMLRDWGVSTRVVTGMAYGENSQEFHAWNIVRVDGKYYGLDATWDSGQTEYQYFLKGTAHFSDHVPGASFAAFPAQYPMAREDYPGA